MAYTATDLAAFEDAMRRLVAGARMVSVTQGDKSVTYADTDILKLQALIDQVRIEVAAAARTFSPRTYAGQGGRGR